MFGYVRINKPELKVKDYGRYRAYYCGLCKTLKKKYGWLGQVTLTYDMTFLILLLTSLYEGEGREWRCRCLPHPTRKRMVFQNEFTQYAADMNIALSYHHFKDDWKDERKAVGFVGACLYKGKAGKVARAYPRQCQAMEESLDALAKYEREGVTDIDTVSGCFGGLMRELFAYREDAFAPIMRNIGFYLGKFIYIMDAYVDWEEDEKNHSFNPFIKRAKEEGFEEYILELLTLMIAEAAKEFEKLPCEWELDILRNILYEGVWSKYGGKKEHG